MKKIYFLAGLAAMTLASCSNSDEPESQLKAPETAQAQQMPIGFDAYIQRGLTRNGAEGELTLDGTVKLTDGFGVFAYYTDNDDYDGNTIPNFMWNQKVSTNAWTYEPVKYWPNEFGTANADEADRISFFAYAPYIAADVASGKTTAATGEAEGTGIMAFSRNNATGDPFVKYIVNLDPTKAVDLCWGTVGASDVTWKKANKISSANETQVFPKELPWLNVQRPYSVSQNDAKVKFQFEHALAQLNIQVKNDVDIASPAAAGDDVKSQTRVWIRSVTLTGFTSKGALNLNSTSFNKDNKAKANWASYNNCGELATGEEYTIYDGRKDGKEGTAAAGNEKIIGINPALVQSDPYVTILPTTPVADAELKISDAVTGVTKTFQNLFSGQTAAGLEAPIYVIPTGDAVKVTIAYDVETYDPNLSPYLSDGKIHGSTISNVITKDIKVSDEDMILENGKKYTIKLHLGLNSVKFDANVTGWTAGTTADPEPSLPANE